MGRARAVAELWSMALAVPLAAAIALAPRSGFAQPQRAPPPSKPLGQSLPPDARRDYDAGKLLFEDGDYATALLKYLAAYDRTHDARLLWNVAVCKKNLRHYAKAAATLAQYIVEGGGALSAQDRRDAQDLMKAIAPFTVAETIQVSQPDAQVRIDDELIGTSPLPGPVSLDIGTRRLHVQKDGYRAVDRELPIGGSADTTVEVLLDRQVGHLTLNVPAAATVAIDDQEVGRGPRVDVDLSAGAHAARVSAAKMRTLQTDILVEDNKSRTLDLGLDAETAPYAEVHVAVACEGPDPLSENELSVFFDDATESALPMGVRMRRESGRPIVAYVPYRVTPGKHNVHIAAKGCSGRDAEVIAPEGGVAEVRGELPPANAYFDGSPAGSPDGWRVSAGVVESSMTFSSYSGFYAANPLPASVTGAGTAVGVTMVGPTASVGLQGRWLTALLDARLLFAHVSGAGAESAYNSTLSQWSIGVRPGVRLPLVIAALSVGVDLHVGQFFFFPDAAGSAESGIYGGGSIWGAIDVQPFCEWGGQVGAAANVDGYGAKGTVGNSGTTILWIQGTFTPNATCDRRRAGLFKIEGRTR